MKTGIANLPLHYGSTPRWLFDLMTKLAREITAATVYEAGPQVFLQKLSDPVWFQAFGAVLGFDWHSSGVTTTVGGALKVGLKGTEKELGIFVCGGKGRASRKTPTEIETIGDRIGKNIQPLVYASKMAAKVDSAALQDGYCLYHHNFVFTRGNHWVVIQQGMNINTRWARRYHWLSDDLTDFTQEPHKAICSDNRGVVMNLIAKSSKTARDAISQIAKDLPGKNLKLVKKIRELKMPKHENIQSFDFNPNSIKKILLSTYERQPVDFEELLGIAGVGPKTIRALALISELIYDAPYSTEDPVKYSFAHGGKDSTPYSVDRKIYCESIDILHSAVNRAKIGVYDKMAAIERLRLFDGSNSSH